MLSAPQTHPEVHTNGWAVPFSATNVGPPSTSNIVSPSVVNSTIDRSAAQSAKGPRLQRLRAALFLLDAVAEPETIHAYVSVETEGDVFVATVTPSASRAYSEEDKNYGEEAAFSFVTDSVLNSVVIFVDQWLNWHSSMALRFGLYTTVEIAKEKNVGRAKQLGLSLPAKPILEMLRARDYSDPNIIPCIRALVLHEYEAQYARSQNQRGHLATLQQWTPNEWIDFLGLIRWLFSEADEAVSLQKLVDGVRKCKLFTEQHDGKENLIYSAILELLDQKQLARDFCQRFVHVSEVKLLFKQVESGEIRCVDPTWRTGDSLPAPNDQRNVGEKFSSVCPGLSATTLNRYQRRTADGHIELEAHSQDKNVRAMRYQIYDVCESALAALAVQAPKLTETQLAAEIDSLTVLAVARVAERAKEYGYSHKTDGFIRGIVLELFDSCFLAFDRVAP